jgi:cytochrome c peroxidase
VDDQGELTTPAGEDLPDGVVTVLQAQALFPVTSRDEMRGSLSDAAAGNELAAIDDDDLPEIWNALMTRLLAYPDYVNLFANAFPETAVGDLGFEHAAIAIAAFEATAFGYDDSPFDNYLRGDNDSLTEAQKRGALLFYGSTGCVRCHSGTLLTDQEHHNLAVPQLGPGKDPATGLDFGRSAISLDDADLFRFRTPPLRNVTATGPYMHNGAFNDLEGAVRHHLQTLQSFQGYDPDSELLQAELAELVVDDRATNLFLLQDVDIRSPNLGKKAFADLMSFLEALTVPNLDERLLLTIPDSVPSGLLESGL